MTWVLLAVAGGVGAVARFVVDAVVVTHAARHETTRRPRLPLGTLTVNVLGSFLLGLLVGAVAARAADPVAAQVLGTGFCGGFTTFGTASLDAARLGLDRRPGLAVVCVLAHLAGAVAAALIGLTLGASLG